MEILTCIHHLTTIVLQGNTPQPAHIARCVWHNSHHYHFYYYYYLLFIITITINIIIVVTNAQVVLLICRMSAMISKGVFYIATSAMLLRRSA